MLRRGATSNNCSNCPIGTSLSVLSCELVGTIPKAVARKIGRLCSVAQNSLSLCVSLAKLGQKPRVIRATVRGADSSGKSIDVTVTVRIYPRPPKVGSNPACLLV